MVGVIQRMRKLKATWSIRNGIGAAIFGEQSAPQPVTRIHLTYARKMYQGHIGARRFWRECLPRLKYYNPSVPMTVKQTEQQDSPAWLTIYFDKSAAIDSAAETQLKDTLAPKPSDSEKTASLDIRNLDTKSIWSQVKRLTKAQEVAKSNEDQAEEAERRVFDAVNEKRKAKFRRERQALKDYQAMARRALEGAQKQTR